MKINRTIVFLLASTISIGGCATLSGLRNLVRPPQFDQDRSAEIRLLQPSRSQPLGGAGVRLWTRVTNPNPFGLTISTLRATLSIEDRRAATGDFPLGLPLRPREESVIPIDLEVDFADLPAVAAAVRRAASGGRVGYQLDGTVGVDAGPLGEPVFGPMTLVRGELQAIR
jgi:hypothetical protein